MTFATENMISAVHDIKSLRESDLFFFEIRSNVNCPSGSSVVYVCTDMCPKLEKVSTTGIMHEEFSMVQIFSHSY